MARKTLTTKTAAAPAIVMAPAWERFPTRADFGLEPIKFPAFKIPARNAAGVSRSWGDQAVRAARITKHGVVVTHDGKVTEHRSVAEAFRAHRLPFEKHIKFRLALKQSPSGQSVFESGGKFYTFSLVLGVATEDHPTLPRMVTTQSELRSILHGGRGVDEPKLLAGVRYYIESYVYLRCRLVSARAAWIVVFRGGVASDENLNSAERDSNWLEETAEFTIALNRATTEDTMREIFTPEWFLKDLDRIITRGESKKVVKEAMKQRREIIATLERRTSEEYERLMANVTKGA
ncbi:hypothetical protein [Caballeronia sp. INDeC2]|uniref:hypothetical protein n=1 Tax=Caballeronia sp. INDeC2 TaxID=2921747 RepID=UPI0020280913|nr:hypothetical protein [Caballeronia sp. INDeC2]